MSDYSEHLMDAPVLDSLSKLVAVVPRAPAMLRDREGFGGTGTCKEIRVPSHLLHPPLLDEVGFSSVAEWYGDGFTNRSGIQTNLELSATPCLTKDEELVFFRNSAREPD